MADEYEHYLQQDTIVPANQTALSWWLEPTQQTKYPNLSCMAVDILSIPPMSDKTERVFSGAKLTLTDRRNKLGTALLRAFECIKLWHKLKDFDIGDALDTFIAGGGFGPDLENLGAETV